MTEEIMALCRAMGVPENQEALLLPLIQTVQNQLVRQLKKGTVPEDCGTAFPLAAAMMAVERLSAVAEGGSEVTSFTAGDLTIRRESGQSGSLSQQAKELLAPWLENTGFIFQGVKG